MHSLCCRQKLGSALFLVLCSFLLCRAGASRPPQPSRPRASPFCVTSSLLSESVLCQDLRTRRCLYKLASDNIDEWSVQAWPCQKSPGEWPPLGGGAVWSSWAVGRCGGARPWRVHVCGPCCRAPSSKVESCRPQWWASCQVPSRHRLHCMHRCRHTPASLLCMHLHPNFTSHSAQLLQAASQGPVPLKAAALRRPSSWTV